MRGGLLSRFGTFAPLIAAALSCSYALGQEAQKLPQSVPVPELQRDAPASEKPPAPQDVPLPEPRPESGPDLSTPPKPQDIPVQDIPVPEANPKKDQQALPEKPSVPEPVEPTPPDPRSGERPAATMPPEELACRRQLTALGVKFEALTAKSDPAGCSIPYPLAVKSLGKAIDLEPEAVMNCAMAEASARFMKDVVSPAAKAEFGEELTSINQASAYVCRPRNGTRKLSEHAFGNALDIASFTIGKDTRIEVILRPEEKQARFLGALRKAGCGPFKTVLGPGSDADHALHFHFDLAPRHNGGTFCQ